MGSVLCVNRATSAFSSPPGARSVLIDNCNVIAAKSPLKLFGGVDGRLNAATTRTRGNCTRAAGVGGGREKRQRNRQSNPHAGSSRWYYWLACRRPAWCLPARGMPVEQISVATANDDQAQPLKSQVLHGDEEGTDGEENSLTCHDQHGTSVPSICPSNQDICRICHCEGDDESPLMTPCHCMGSLRFVHQACLQQWIKSSDTRSCELCKYNFLMESKLKTLRKWEKLQMSGSERRKIVCSVTFHIIAITCVIWSLYVLIDRTAEEIRQGQRTSILTLCSSAFCSLFCLLLGRPIASNSASLICERQHLNVKYSDSLLDEISNDVSKPCVVDVLEWPFWTKLVVVAIGFTGGLVFMYVQCKVYVQLWRRLKAYNRVIYVQNCPEASAADKWPHLHDKLPLDTGSERWSIGKEQQQPLAHSDTASSRPDADEATVDVLQV